MKATDILQLEDTNARLAYLFEEDGRWYAYEKSANRIAVFLKGIWKIKQKFYDVCGQRRVEIDMDILENCPIALCEDSVLIIDCPGGPSYSS